MKPSTDLDRRLTDWLDAEASEPAPDRLLHEALDRVGHTHPRPGWRIPERWIPMRVSMALAVVPRAVLLMLMLLVVLALVASAYVAASPGPSPLPPPTGLARNGLIAFDSGGDIWVTSVDGRERRQLTSGPDIDFNPTWSPDGRSIAYLSDRADPLAGPEPSGGDMKRMLSLGTRPADLVVSDSTGANARTVAHDLGVDPATIPMWSPDGGSIALSLTEDRISVVDAIDLSAPGTLVRIADHARFPTWSPDGASLAFQGAATTSDQGVYRQSLTHGPGEEPERLTMSFGSGYAFAYPQWSPDGTQLLYYAGADGVHDIWRIGVPAAPEDPVSIADDLADEYWPMWSPDGKRIAFQRVVARTNNLTRFVLADPDGQDPVTLDSDPLFAGMPVWSPDGTAILGYVPDAQGVFGTHLIVMPVDGSTPILIDAPRNIGNASWQRLAP